MKKRTAIISVTLAAALAASLALLAGCSGDHYTTINIPNPQDTGYTVTSQGGSAVAYGNYVYFINGTRGYEDTDGNANVWDSVVKGGLYRAELNGEKYTDKNDGLTKFRSAVDGKGMEFKYTETTDYFDVPVNSVNVDKIAPKTIGTTGYGDGGIFIYDNYAYFATPNNQKNSTGTVQATRTDFFMMPLMGGKPVKLYTSSEGVDTSSSAYAFYKRGGFVYLVVNENGTIVSVKINPAKTKTEDPVAFEVKATSVYFPVRDTYYNGISSDTVEDFIYFVRDVKDGEMQRAGTVIEAMRPDGSENFIVSMTGKTETIEAVRDGLIFFRTVDGAGNTVIAYDNLHDRLMEFSGSYKAAQEALDANKRNSGVSGRFPTAITSTITSTYAFRPDTDSNDVYFVGVTSSDIKLYCNITSSPLVGTIANITGTPKFIKENHLYFSDSNNDYFRVPLFENMTDYKADHAPQKLTEGTSTATFGCDYAAGYFTYFGKVDDWADGYAYFYKVDGAEGMEKQFVGLRASADIPTEKQIEDAKNGNSGTDNTENTEGSGETNA